MKQSVPLNTYSVTPIKTDTALTVHLKPVVYTWQGRGGKEETEKSFIR